MQDSLEDVHVQGVDQNAGPAVLDRDHLARYTMGDAALEIEVLQLFATHTTTQIQQLKDAIGDADRWHAATHGVKGSARGIGAWALAAAAEAAELDRAGASDIHVRHVSILLKQIGTVNAVISRHIDGH